MFLKRLNNCREKIKIDLCRPLSKFDPRKYPEFATLKGTINPVGMAAGAET